MTPFAYQFLRQYYDDIEDNEVFTTLRAAYEYVLKEGYVARPDSGLEIDCWYTHPIRGGESRRHSLSLDSEAFQHRRALDMDALRLEARQMIAEDKARQGEWLKTIKGTVTGSPWLCDYGEDHVVNGLIQKRAVVWKTPDEVDWPAILAGLEEVEAR